jgi:hypothetical protein
MGLSVLYKDSFTFLYVNDFPTSQETHLCASTDSYEDSLTFLYVDYIRTSQGTPMGFHGL